MKSQKKSNRLKRPREFNCNLSFSVTWEHICQNSQENEIDNNISLKNKSLHQVPLVTKDNTFKQQIDYSKYTQVPYEELQNMYDCFHGIIFYIYYYSYNKLNTEELEFSLSDDLSKDVNGDSRFTDILSICDYESTRTKIQVGPTRNAFFCANFKRIEIKPLCYSLRLGSFFNNHNFFVSFNFEAFNEKTKEWEILDVRLNVEYNITSFVMFPVKSSNVYYSSFRIHQTEPIDSQWGFNLIAFDIHGDIKYKETLIDNLSETCSNTFLYDPCIDMIPFL